MRADHPVTLEGIQGAAGAILRDTKPPSERAEANQLAAAQSDAVSVEGINGALVRSFQQQMQPQRLAYRIAVERYILQALVQQDKLRRLFTTLHPCLLVVSGASFGNLITALTLHPLPMMFAMAGSA